jgi:2'-5' RNA ligase
MEKPFLTPGYIVMEMPEVVAEKIKFMRSWYDSIRADLPVEITITGSSGVGTIAPDETLENVIDVVNGAVNKFIPFETAFDKIERFAGTDVFYFTMKNPEKFRGIHNYFLNSGIKFNPVQYPEFLPHCTIKLLTETSAQEAADLFNTVPMKEPFIMDRISIYTLKNDLISNLLYSAAMQDLYKK